MGKRMTEERCYWYTVSRKPRLEQLRDGLGNTGFLCYKCDGKDNTKHCYTNKQKEVQQT